MTSSGTGSTNHSHRQDNHTFGVSRLVDYAESEVLRLYSAQLLNQIAFRRSPENSGAIIVGGVSWGESKRRSCKGVVKRSEPTFSLFASRENGHRSMSRGTI